MDSTSDRSVNTAATTSSSPSSPSSSLPSKPSVAWNAGVFIASLAAGAGLASAAIYLWRNYNGDKVEQNIGIDGIAVGRKKKSKVSCSAETKDVDCKRSEVGTASIETQSKNPAKPDSITTKPHPDENRIIQRFLSVSKEMLSREVAGAGPEALESLQRERQMLVTSLHNVGGDSAVDRLKSSLACLEPPPPPPGPSELLYKSRLAMKIMEDPNFKVKRSDENMSKMEKMVADTVKKAYWDRIRSRISEGSWKDVTSLIEELRFTLLQVLQSMPRARKIAEELNSIDVDFISQQIEAGAFSNADIISVVQTFHSVFSKLQSAARDTSTNKWLSDSLDMLQKSSSVEQLGAVIEPIFSGAFSIIEDIQVDLLNYQISLMKPYLQKNGKEWHKTAFEERLKQNDASLQRTVGTLYQTIQDEVKARSADIEKLRRGDSESYRAIWRVSVMTCVFAIADKDKFAEGGHDIGKLVPEILEASTHQVSKLAKLLREVIESLYVVLKTKFFFDSHQVAPPATEVELQSIFDFSMSLAGAGVEEKTSSIEIEGKTMTVFSSSNPHGEKGRRKRMESMAAFVFSLYEKRTSTVGKTFVYADLLKFFMQFADKKENDAVMQSIVMLCKKKICGFARLSVWDEAAKVSMSAQFAKRNMGAAVPRLIEVIDGSRNIAARTASIHAEHLTKSIFAALNDIQNI